MEEGLLGKLRNNTESFRDKKSNFTNFILCSSKLFDQQFLIEKSINLMFQKQKFNLKFAYKRVDILWQIAPALDNTFVVDAQFKQPEYRFSTRKIIHQTAEGKKLLQLANESTSQNRVGKPFFMMNDSEVIIFLTTQARLEIQVINLKSKHISKSFLDKTIFEQNLNKLTKWSLETVYLFPQTQLVSFVAKEYYYGSTRVQYYKYNQLQEGKAKPVRQYFFQGKNVKVNNVNDCSKIAVWRWDGSTITSLTFLNQKEELKTLSSLRCSWFDSKSNENVNKDEKYQMDLIECRPDFYFLKIKCWVDFLIVGIKYGFLDTSKEDKISKEVLISTKGIPYNRLCFQPLKNTILFFGWFNSDAKQSSFPSYFFDFQQQAMVDADYQQAGVKCQKQFFFFPNWDRNAFVRVQENIQSTDEIGVTVTRVISRFPLKNISMHMLLHLNEDFDDDLLQDAIQMLCEM